MDLLKKELEKKKKAVALAKEQREQSGSKFLKTSELRKIQEEQEERERTKRKQSSLHEPTAQPDSNKRQRPAEGGSKQKDSQPTKDAARKKKKSVSSVDATTSLSPESVMQRLRAMGLPIRVFGESESDRLERLNAAMEQQQHVMAGLSEMDEFRLGSGHGIRNPFLESKREQNQDEPETSVAKAVKPDSEHRHEEEKDESADDDPHKRIYRFFKGILRQWEDDLALRPEAAKRTAAGRNETKTLKQCKDYIRPLFKLCKTRRLEESLMAHILKIVEYCEAGEFVKAHDSYIDMAIGRAAWPIGVTMVGIHARSGRAKIESSNVAHVMNSELQRKYLTSVKRLMTYCQTKRDDVAPSKKVMN